MPTGVYGRTDYHRNCISQGQIGRSPTKTSFKKGHKIRWRGGRIKDGFGYILIFSPKHPFCNKSKYVREHRLVIEKILGRYLTKKETVHHLGEKYDNRPCMLMAFITDSAHLRFEKNGIIKPEEILFDGRSYELHGM